MLAEQPEHRHRLAAVQLSEGMTFAAREAVGTTAAGFNADNAASINRVAIVPFLQPRVNVGVWHRWRGVPAGFRFVPEHKPRDKT